MRRHSRATGAAAIDFTVAPITQFQLNEVRVHLSAGGAATNLTITLVAAASEGTEYDQVLLTQAMGAVTDVILLPAQPHDFVAGDAIVVEYANGGAVTYGLDVIWSRTA